MNLLSKDICLIIYHRNALEDLQATLSSLHSAFQLLNEKPNISMATTLRLLVCDNGSRPDFADQVERFLRKEEALWAPLKIEYFRSILPRSRGECLTDAFRGVLPTPFALILDAGMIVSKNFFAELSLAIASLNGSQSSALKLSLSRGASPIFASAWILPIKIWVESKGFLSVQNDEALEFEIPNRLFQRGIEFKILKSTSDFSMLADERQQNEWDEALFLRARFFSAIQHRLKRFEVPAVMEALIWLAQVLGLMGRTFWQQASFKTALNAGKRCIAKDAAGYLR